MIINLEDAIKEASKYDKEIFIVGGSRLYNEVLESSRLDKIYYTHINKSFGCDNFVNPILDRDDMTYEIIDTIKYDRIDIENPYKILTNVVLTFYLITKK
jgi:dihydrofolate reductase